MSAVLTIGGTTINRVTTRTTLIRCRPYAKDAYPTLSFARCIGPLTPGPDPWDGQPVTLTQTDVVPIVYFGGGGGSGATATATIAGGVVTGVIITNGGSGYTSAPAVGLLGGYGSGAAATAAISAGQVSSVVVTSGGSGYVSTAPLLFSGDTGTHLTHYDPHLGWVREWTCYGLAKRAEYIPVTDSLTLTDTARYNLTPDDPDYLPSRAGRTIGQIVADVLDSRSTSPASASFSRSRESCSRATPTISSRSTPWGTSASSIPGPSPTTSRW